MTQRGRKERREGRGCLGRWLGRLLLLGRDASVESSWAISLTVGEIYGIVWIGVLIINRPVAADSLDWMVLIGILTSEGASGASSLFYSLTGWYVRPRGDTYFIGFFCLMRFDLIFTDWVTDRDHLKIIMIIIK